MKKTIFLSAVAALFTFASCQKEEASVQNQENDRVFTATIAGQNTKTTIDASTAKVSWVSGDEITITDAATTSAKYTVSSIDAQGKAIFTKVDGQPTLGAGPYTAVYGTDPTTAQTYSSSAPALPMSASSSTTTLEFTVTCGLLELNLTAGESITSIEVKGTPAGGSETIYTLTCSTAVSIASSAKFFIALPAGTYTSFLFNGENGVQCKKEKSGSSVAITANHITPVSFSKDLHFVVQLWKDGPYWSTTNIGAFSPTDYGYYFPWGNTDACVRNSDNNGWVLASDGTTEKQFNTTYYPHTSDFTDAATSSWGTDWSTPTDTDFSNLINSSNTEVETVAEGIKGLRIKGKTGTAYEGCSIFLPAAGSGSGANASSVGTHCYYWSSVEESKDSAWHLSTAMSLSVKKYTKHYGYPIRPVRSSL